MNTPRYTQLKGGLVPIRLWARMEEVDSLAVSQLRRVAGLPWVFHHVAAMPDVHVGRGATVGSVIAMKGAVAPAAVGVDMGCGMCAVKTSLTASQLPDNLHGLRVAVEERVPVGKRSHVHPVWPDMPPPLKRQVEALWAAFPQGHHQANHLMARAQEQLGTLGGGNHFLEVCVDGGDAVWLMLHSGSRNVGASLAEHHLGAAAHLDHNRALRDPDLAVFLAGTAEFAAYRRDLFWAQEYARLNRAVMMELLQQALLAVDGSARFEAPISCHHNYVAEEVHFHEDVLVTRKGAISARAGELGIIPGSMGTHSFIVRGLGNPDSFHSASHGAGRRMSRSEARKRFTVRDVEQQTRGVECRKDHGVIDEVPKAYKDIGKVMAQQQDLVEVVAQLKQVVCVKG